MTIQCVPVWRCGTASSGWLKGGHPTSADGEVSSDVCFNRQGDCCKESKKIKIKYLWTAQFDLPNKSTPEKL